LAAHVPEGSGHLLAWLARRRVALGFLFGAAALWLAQPTGASLTLGAVVAVAGEALRVWAAGHLDKAREVTSSGPYRWLAHPLYLGSSVMGVGFVIASRSLTVALLVGLYLTATLTAAVRTEEARLTQLFGAEYDRYRRGARRPEAARRFRMSQVLVNKEHRAISGVLLVWLLLLMKATYNDAFG
jgi:protein-S-isoprenylcysteine O-methyltransferase Ste14